MHASTREMIDGRPAKIEAAKPMLSVLREKYESGFGSIRTLEAPLNIPLGLASLNDPVPLDESSVEIFEHREIAGTGDTAVEALQDWKSWLDKCPQSGKELVWRVPPEIDCWLDFPMQKEVWKVYARFIIVP